MKTNLPPDSSNQTPVLRVQDVAKEFRVRSGSILTRGDGVLHALAGVDFQVYESETLGIVGESGCGKSTLARIILRLEKATSGNVYFREENLMTVPPRRLLELRRHIQMVFQDPFASLDPRMTIAEIVAEPLRIHKGLVPKGQERERSLQLLERVGLRRQDGERHPHQFSGGQRQRIGIARALASEPELLVCDEPVSALDVSVQAQILNLLQELQDELGVSYVFIAHDLSVVRQISDRVAVMYMGKIVETGPSEEVYENPLHPYTQSLLSSVPPAPGRKRRFSGLNKLEGEVPSPINPPSGCRFRTRCWKASERCADEVPDLVDRGFLHPSACHFAEPLDPGSGVGDISLVSQP